MKKNKRRWKYVLITFILTTLFFILLYIKDEKSKQEISTESVAEKINSKIYENTTNRTIKEEKQSTNSKKNVEKEYIETEYKGYKVLAKLNIPKISLETYVLETYSKQALLTSVTKFYGEFPNEIGNFCIAGHNYGPTNMFQNLKKLKINDEIYLTDINGNKMKYTIYDIYTVLPNETSCLSQKTNGEIELTLITCTLDSEKRIIIKAKV